MFKNVFPLSWIAVYYRLATISLESPHHLIMIVICQSTGKEILMLYLVSQVLCCSYVTPAEWDQYYTLTRIDRMRLYG